MARIDYSKVNISLQQFEAIASGKYNAGEVKLAGQNSLGKINNHVTFRIFNNDTISHAEVVAIKNAFVRALGNGGLGAEEIGKVRAQLGLAPSCAADAKLNERSMKPLSRQQIRDILDQYSDQLHVRTYNEIRADVPNETRLQREATRQSVNGSLHANRELKSNRTLVMFQRVLADDVDFWESADYNPMLNEAKRLLDALYRECNDNPSPEKMAKARCELPGGQTVEIDTGMTEAAYAEKLFLTIARLEHMDVTLHRLPNERKEYQNLDHQGRLDWIDAVSDQPNALVKARMAAVLALQEKGITDYEALSLVNKISIDSVVDLLHNLEGPATDENWVMSRDYVVQAMRQYPVHEDGNSGCVYIPATSPSQYNKALRTFFKGISADTTPPAPPGYKQFANDLLSDLRKRFGDDVVPAGDKLDLYLAANMLPRLLQVEGDGDYARNVKRVSIDDLRAPFSEIARRSSAQKVLLQFVGSVVKDANVKVASEQAVVNGLTLRNKELIDTLANCANPDETRNVLASIRDETEKVARRCAILDKYRTKDGFARLVVAKELSEKTGIPLASLKGFAIPETRIRKMALRLCDDINSGKVPADTEDEIKAKFQDVSRKFVEERVRLLANVDVLDVTDATKAELKKWILAQEKVSFIDFDDIRNRISQVDNLAEELSEVLKTVRQKGEHVTLSEKNGVYEAMKKLSVEIDSLIENIFQDRNIDADFPEQSTLGQIITILALGRFVDIQDDIADFLARSDVREEMEQNRENVEEQEMHISLSAKRYEAYVAPKVDETNAEIINGIVSGAPDVMSGQAVVQGCREAGLKDGDTDNPIKPDDAIALFKAGTKLSGELSEAIKGLPAVATPQMIRAIVSSLLQRHFHAGVA